MSASVSLATWEAVTLWASVVGYALVSVAAVIAIVFKKRPERTMLFLMAATVLLHTASLGLRWARLDHVPVTSTFEMLSANVWGLMVAVVLAYWRLPRIRPAALLGLPVIVLVMGWMLMVPRPDLGMPVTYNTVWLYIHIGFIKVFLGAALVALSLSAVILLRRVHLDANRFALLPDSDSLAELAYRFLAVGLIFDTLGIIAGAIWAQDAWGRYWSWDPLEVWSLLTWLSIGFAIHVRASYRPRPTVSAAMVVGVFVIAFFTFFGVPFVSTSLHKGAI